MRLEVADVMTTDVATVQEATPFREIVRLLEGRRVSAAPVVDGHGRVMLVGIVSRADPALRRHGEGGTGMARRRPATDPSGLSRPWRPATMWT